MNRAHTRALSWTRRIHAVLAVALGVGAFVLSYENLGHAAALAFPEPFNWLWPLIIDGFILAGSLDVLRCTLESRPTRFAWTITAAAVAGSVAFNIAYGGYSPLAIAQLALPPLAQALAVEILMRSMRSTLTDVPLVTGAAPVAEPAAAAAITSALSVSTDVDIPAASAPIPTFRAPLRAAPDAPTPALVPTMSIVPAPGGKAQAIRRVIRRWQAEGRDPWARGAAAAIATETNASVKYVRQVLNTVQPLAA